MISVFASGLRLSVNNIAKAFVVDVVETMARHLIP